MSLTKNDLQAIGALLDQKLEEKLESKLEEKLESKLAPIHERLEDSDSKLTSLDTMQLILARQYEKLERLYTATDKKQEDLSVRMKSLQAAVTKNSRTQTRHGKILREVKQKVGKIDWTVNYISKTFDERIVQNIKDIQLIKSNIGLPTKN